VSFCFLLLSLFLSLLSLPSACGSEAAGCMGIGPIQVCPPPLGSLFRLIKPQVPPLPLPPPSNQPTTISPLHCLYLMCPQWIWRRRRRRSPGGSDCLGGLSMCLRDGRVVGRTSSSSYGPMHLYCRPSDWSLCGHSVRWLRPRRLSFPSPSSRFPFGPFVFQAWLIILVCPSLFEFSHVFLTPWAGFRRIIPPFAT